MAGDFLVELFVESLSDSKAGVVFLFGVFTTVLAFWASAVFRRRLLVELQIAREMMDIQQEGAAAGLNLGLRPDEPLARAKWWQDVAYGWSRAKRMTALAIIGALGASSLLLVGLSISRILAGAVLVVLSLALLVVVAAVVFVLVADLGERYEAEERERDAPDAPERI